MLNQYFYLMQCQTIHYIINRIIYCIKRLLISDLSIFQLYSAKRFVEGYHIHIRDMSSKDPHFDVVTLSGGGTRSHTLSDLRPDTKYSIFLLPYYEQITGNPSNLKTVTTKEDGKKNIFNGIYQNDNRSQTMFTQNILVLI